MQISKEKQVFLLRAIEEWKVRGIISEEQALKMKASAEVRKFDWKPVSVYAFIIALACAVLSVVVLLADKPLRVLLEQLTQITDAGISAILTVAALLGLIYAKQRFVRAPDMSLSNNSLLLFSAFLSLAALSYWAKTWQVFQQNSSGIFILSAGIYLGLAVYFSSAVLWVLAMGMTALAYGMYTAFSTGASGLFLGMNLPLRFLPLSVFLLSGTIVLPRWRPIRQFSGVHYVTSLILAYISLWMVSVFGNTASYAQWQGLHASAFWIWGAVLFIVSGIGMFWGLRRQDWILGNTSLAFFLLNLVTRYVEYCWEPLHKSVFFMLLAAAFWGIGSRAEKLWNLNFLKGK